MRVLITRPEPDALKLKGMIEARGHEASVEPLMSVEYRDTADLDLDGVTALIATSRNALRALMGSPHLEQARTLTVFAVGPGTAQEARRMGFRVVVAGPGTAADLIPMIASTLDPMEEVLLHLRGDKVSVDIESELSAHGFRVGSQIVYRMRHAEALSAATRDQLSDGEIEAVLLLSPQTAAIYSRLIKKHKLETPVQEILHLCLSDAVAHRLASLNDVPVDVAEAPTLEEMLALVDLAAAKLDF